MPLPDKGSGPPPLTERELFFRIGATCGVLLVIGCVGLVWLITGQLPDYCS